MEFFTILELEQTTDQDAIKNAYRRKLIAVNPEDDPEGFKRLRSAYEQAMEWAKRPPEEEGPKGPVELLIDRFAKVYQKMEDRVNPDSWRELLKDPLFDSFDLEENAKWSLFVWLADHWRLPQRIWRTLDQAFFIGENIGEFKEHLPEGFVDYMVQKIGEDMTKITEFPYERLRALGEEEHADYDAFLTGYEDFCDMVDSGENPAAEQKLEYLESLRITHPWFLLAKARFLDKTDRRAEAEKIARGLLETDGDEIQVRMGCARLLKKLGYGEETVPVFEEILRREVLPGGVHYFACANLAELYERDGRLEEARKMCLDALDICETDETVEVLTRVNGLLIEKWTKSPDALTSDEAYQLIWCFIQTKRGEDGLAFLEEHPYLTEDYYKYHRAKAILAIETGRYEEALAHCGNWRRKLEEQEPVDETAENKKLTEDERKDSLMQCFRMEGSAFQAMAEKAQNPGEADALFEKAEQVYADALANDPRNMDLNMSRMMLLRARKKYEEMADLCEELKQIDSGFYWAYFYAQEAYEKLHKGQEVVNNFYDAKRIYAGHAEIYERAVEVFLAYRQYHDAEGILNQAKEEGADSPKLKLQRLTMMEAQAEDDEKALQAADAYAEQILAEMEADPETPKEILAAVYLERVYVQTDRGARAFRSAEKVIEWAKRSVELHDTVDARYSLGRAYVLFLDDAKSAMEHLKICEEKGMTFCWLFYYIARCQEDFEEWDEAVAYYKKAMEQDPKETDFAWRVAWLYRRKFSRTGQKAYADLTLEYLKKQEELCERNSTDYWQLSDLYSDLGQYDRALEEIEHALETDERPRNWGQKAQLLELMHRRDEAVPFYEKGIEASLERDADYSFAYSQMADYFRETGKCEEGIAWFEAGLEKLKSEEQRDKNLDFIRKIYLKMGQYDKALELVQRKYGSTELNELHCDSWEKEGERIEDLLDVYQYYLTPQELEQKVTEALALLEGEHDDKCEESLSGKYGVYREIAYSYAHYIMDDEMGLQYFQKAYQILLAMEEEAKAGDLTEIFDNLMACSYRLGEKELALKYRDLFLQQIAKRYEECTDIVPEGEKPDVISFHLNSCIRRRYNLYQLFVSAFYTEEYDSARTYLEEMADSPWCSFCTCADCTELWFCRGLMALHDGEYEKARECFLRADECATSSSSEAKFELRRLERIGGKG